MRRRWSVFVAGLVVVAAIGSVHADGAQQAGNAVVASPTAPAGPPAAMSPVVERILVALRVVEQRRLWPGFDLQQVPVAIFDGQRTFLYRHPAPPPEFVAVPGADGLRVSQGQHADVRANTSAEIGGVLTATCLAAPDADPERLAAIVAHEAFHVFQRQTHPDWSTNEMNLFTYPADDVKNLGSARVEAMLIEKAVASIDRFLATCSAAAAMKRRAQRFAALSSDAADYERGVELVEGTASLVQLRAGDQTQPSISVTGFRADATRLRAYASGRLLGLLLDRLAPGWEQGLGAVKAPVLGDLLAKAAGDTGNGCSVTPAEESAQMAAAEEDVAAFVARRDAARREFAEAPGWQVTVRAPAGGAFGPQGFDPMNVVRVGGNDVLHTRWLKAGTKTGFVEVLNRRSLTRAAGDHPLFSGFREVVITGLPTEPVVTLEGDGLELRADGVTATFLHAAVQRADRAITIVVASGSPTNPK